MRPYAVVYLVKAIGTRLALRLAQLAVLTLAMPPGAAHVLTLSPTVAVDMMRRPAPAGEGKNEELDRRTDTAASPAQRQRRTDAPWLLQRVRVRHRGEEVLRAQPAHAVVEVAARESDGGLRGELDPHPRVLGQLRAGGRRVELQVEPLHARRQDGRRVEELREEEGRGALEPHAGSHTRALCGPTCAVKSLAPGSG